MPSSSTRLSLCCKQIVNTSTFMSQVKEECLIQGLYGQGKSGECFLDESGNS